MPRPSTFIILMRSRYITSQLLISLSAVLLAGSTKVVVFSNPFVRTSTQDIGTHGIDSASIDILEKMSTQNLPVDDALRWYTKQKERSFVNSEEYKSLSDVLRGISISQYRIDWRLRDAGIECTPENRVACALGCDWIESSQQLRTTINYRSYPWLQDVLKRGKALECDRMDL